MSFSKRAIPLVVAALVIACSGSRPERRPAYGAFDQAAYADAWQRSVDAVRAQGFELEMQDQARGILVTRERELQAPCGAETCLSRERLYLRLTPSGQAIANLLREHWDVATRQWSPSADPASIAAVEKAQSDLLAPLVKDGKVTLRKSAQEEPCTGDDECEKGLACVARRCAKAKKG
ncbi:MAG TPA: hypothetical protein VFP65_14855 [Anaeromyxobacteraceae bacterium]|nr:hypothetical protein [Anaeromyxobacteraceae bacterium]